MGESESRKESGVTELSTLVEEAQEGNIDAYGVIVERFQRISPYESEREHLEEARVRHFHALVAPRLTATDQRVGCVRMGDPHYLLYLMYLSLEKWSEPRRHLRPVRRHHSVQLVWVAVKSVVGQFEPGVQQQHRPRC